MDGSNSKLMDNIELKGDNVQYQIESSEYGNVMNISGSGNSQIIFSYLEISDISYYFNKSRHPENGIDMNLWTSSDNDQTDYNLGNVWIFLNRKDNSVQNTFTIYLNLQIGEVYHSTKDNIKIEDGWQQINIQVYAVVP